MNAPAALALIGIAALAPLDVTTGAEPVELPAAILERYTGSYALGDNLVITIARSDRQLSAQLTGQPALPIYPETLNSFVYRAVDARIDFLTDAQGSATALVLHQNGADHAATRIDAAVAQQMASTVSARVQAQTPAPGSEAAVRRLLAALSAGSPNYGEMTPALAQATRLQLPQLRATLATLGAVQSVSFQGVGNQGWDLYLVHHEHGLSQVRIMLNADGVLAGALISAGP